MSYETGTTTDPVDLLQKLVAFLSTYAGWTVNLSQAAGTGHWKAHLNKNAVYINLFAQKGSGSGWNPWGYSLHSSSVGATDGNLFLYGSEGYSAGNWESQPGRPIVNGTSYTAGADMQLVASNLGTYHFFASGDCVAVFAEGPVGIWKNMGWGMLQKAGVYTGGQYFWGSWAHYYALTKGDYEGSNLDAYAPCANSSGYNSNSSLAYVRADVDSFVNKWVCIGGITSTTYRTYTGLLGYSSAYGYDSPPTSIVGSWGLRQRALSSLTGQVTLTPIRLFVPRDTGGYSLVGTVPDCFEALTSGIPTGTVFQIGADEYIRFPYCLVRKVA